MSSQNFSFNTEENIESEICVSKNIMKLSFTEIEEKVLFGMDTMFPDILIFLWNTSIFMKNLKLGTKAAKKNLRIQFYFSRFYQSVKSQTQLSLIEEFSQYPMKSQKSRLLFIATTIFHLKKYPKI